MINIVLIMRKGGKVLTVICLLLISAKFLCAQGMMVYEKKIDGVKESLKRRAKKIKATYSDYTSGDTLIVQMGCDGGNTNKFLFSKTTGYCSFHSVEFNCDECMEKSVQSILYDLYYNWRIVSKDKYISNYSYRTGLILERENDKVKKIVLKYIETSEDEYKARYESLEDIPKRIKKK